MVTENNYLEIYRAANFDLAGTIVIKSDHTAQLVNRYLKAKGLGPIEEDRRTWKYYLNLAGEYHATDQRMEVISLDTAKPILFSKENLREHRATARAYSYGTRRYRELLLLYPTQRRLIQGILHPADIDKVIAAKEYDIVAYAPHLVEENETTLIRSIGVRIHDFVARWSQPAYRISDNLYEAAIFGVLGPKVVEMIYRERLARCRTDEVNSFFIKMYLASNGGLDRYLDVLTQKQKLWLYRNLPWVRRNIGRTENYEWLIENLLTERYVPLMAYGMKHDTEEVLEEVVPRARFLPTARNYLVSEADIYDRSTEDMLYLEEGLAAGNRLERETRREEIEQEFRHSPSHRVSTKVLQSIMMDYAGSETHTFEEILINHWVYLSDLGIYNSYVQLINPRTGSVEPLPAKDAFILSMYLLLTIHGFEPTIIPPVTVSRVQRIIKPSLAELKAHVDSKYIEDSELLQIINLNPEIIPIISIDAFHERCFQIFRAGLAQEAITANAHHLDRRGFLQKAIDLMYGTKECILTNPPEQRFEDWFKQRQINIQDYMSNPLENYTDIMRAALGLDLELNTSVRDIQAAMLNILEQHSSYSIQLVKTINEGTIRPVGNIDPRFGDVSATGSSQIGLIEPVKDLLGINGKPYSLREGNFLGDNDVVDLNATFKDILCVPIEDPLILDGKGTPVIIEVEMYSEVFIDEEDSTDIGELYDLPGMNLYKQLTDEQRRNIPEIDPTTRQ